ncbi:hypothetical protein MMC19_006925 [Ptychographa xylographoides]|nr:hypothetical protein [Ptychographa xylographoides]
MEAQVDRLVEKTWGSGKTTLAQTITARLNALAAHSPTPPAAFLPMDGFHFSRAALSAFPDPITAFARRGAAFTFDAPAFLALVRRLRAPIVSTADASIQATPTYYAPSFDHARKDPVADDIALPPSARIIILEGNYLSLDRGEWAEAAALMDDLWFVEVPEEVARTRLVERHVRTGVARDREEAGRRADENDLVNGREIVASRVLVDEVVRSVEDGAWAPVVEEKESEMT